MLEKKTGYPSIDRTHLEGIPEEILHPQILPLSILAAFRIINKDHMADEAVEEQNGAVWTKSDVEVNSVICAGALTKLGLKAGDAIIIATHNCYKGIVTMIGANAIGIKTILANPLANSEELAEMIERFRAKLIFVDGKSKDEAKNLADKCNYSTKIVIVNSNEDIPSWSNARYFDFAAFYTFGYFINFDKINEEIKKYSMYDDEALIYLQTSGSSSGKPKLLPFKNSAIYAALIFASNSTGTQTNDANVKRVLCLISYRMTYGWMPLFVNLIGGNTVVLASGLGKKDIANYYKHKASYIYGTPAFFRTFMDETPENADLSDLVAFFCAGFIVPENWFLEGSDFFQKHNSKAEIRNNYGVGEALGVGTSSDGIPHKPNTSGKFYVGPEWLVVDENLNEVKYGEIGETIVSSPTLCQGYYGEKELTEKHFIYRDGKLFYRTGDLMRLYEDGYVQYIGRMSRRFYMPLGSPDKVNCETVENEITKCWCVKECVVVSVQRYSDGNDIGVAFITSNDNFYGTHLELEANAKEYAENNLYDYQVPERFCSLNSIPLGPSGKPNYSKLEEMAKEYAKIS